MKKSQLIAGAALALALSFTACQADETVPVQAVKIPQHGALGRTYELSTLVFLPPGNGPFPVVIVNHGKAPGAARRQPDAMFPPAEKVFTARGYAVVVPTRAGFGTSSGYHSSGISVERSGNEAADSIQAAVEWVRAQPQFDPGRLVLIGQSHGGLGVAAASARNLPGVRAIINFAGGLRTCSAANASCGDDGQNLDAFQAYGKTARQPVLMMYGDNDSFWGTDGIFPRKMFEAYHAGNPDSEFFDEGTFEENSHMIFHRNTGTRLWVHRVMQFLQARGLPTKPLYDTAVHGLHHDGVRVVTDGAYMEFKPRQAAAE